MNRRRSSTLKIGAWVLGSALLSVGSGAAVWFVHHARAQRAAEAERVRAAEQQARDDRRRRELQAGIDRFGAIKVELSAFGQWLRLVRPAILAGQARRTLGDIECTAARGRTGPAVTCSAHHFPHGGPTGIRYEVVWYRDHPEDMRGMASEVPYSPLFTCHRLGLRQLERRSEDQGRVTVLDCAVPDSTESYTIRHSVGVGAQSTIVLWYSAGYPRQERANPRLPGASRAPEPT